MLNNNIMSMLQSFRSNPMSMLSRRFNIPQNFSGDANSLIQYLMSTGQVTQDQYNQANQAMRMLQNNPNFSKFFAQK